MNLATLPPQPLRPEGFWELRWPEYNFILTETHPQRLRGVISMTGIAFF